MEKFDKIYLESILPAGKDRKFKDSFKKNELRVFWSGDDESDKKFVGLEINSRAVLLNKKELWKLVNTLTDMEKEIDGKV